LHAYGISADPETILHGGAEADLSVDAKIAHCDTVHNDKPPDLKAD
jgi:hypothetical protein